MSYVCPICTSKDLGVCVLTSAKLIQDPDGNIQTETVDDSHEWDHSHSMWCNECGYRGGGNSFWKEPTP